MIEKIEKMRNGEKIKCSCGEGFISAVGNPKGTHLFKCDGCGKAITMTKKINIKEYINQAS